MDTEQSHLLKKTKFNKKLSWISELRTLAELLTYTGCLAILLPSYFLYQTYNSASAAFGLKKRVIAPSSDDDDETIDFTKIRTSNNRDIDIVLFGATGFTGDLCARYLAERYRGTGLKWALAGRRVNVLKDIRRKLCDFDPALADMPVLVADSDNLNSLAVLASRTKVVLTTVGPYAKYGRKLVKACANLGTHYADITGETDFVRRMIDLYDDTARSTGAKIVAHCGNDCIPWDLAVWELHKVMRARGDTLVGVRAFDDYLSAPSGGTLATVALGMEARGGGGKYKSRLGFDPLLKEEGGSKSSRGFKTRLQSGVEFNAEEGNWCAQFFMAPVMANCIRRSNALLGYSGTGAGAEPLSYYEGEVHQSMLRALLEYVKTYTIGALVLTHPLGEMCRWLGFLPHQGQGPSSDLMEAGYLNVKVCADGVRGTKATCEVQFPSDPGYRETARMLVEAGMALLEEGDTGTSVKGGGVLTPAAALGDQLSIRLCATGSTVSMKV